LRSIGIRAVSERKLHVENNLATHVQRLYTISLRALDEPLGLDFQPCTKDASQQEQTSSITKRAEVRVAGAVNLGSP
jgi:hypothetical protein